MPNATTSAAPQAMVQEPEPREDKEPPSPPQQQRPTSFLPGRARAGQARARLFPEATDREWNDWRWQLAHRVCTAEELVRAFSLSEEEKGALAMRGALPFAVTPYYLDLADPEDPADPIRRMVVPTMAEHLASPGEAFDPLGEESHSPAPGLVHRYPDRVLFLATDFCSTYCRYCTRSRLVGRGGRDVSDEAARGRWSRALDYIRAHTEVRDVLISGGDPLTLGDKALEWLLTRLRAIEHVEIVRIGSKVPAVLPQRVTPALARLLARFHPLFISLHFCHPAELTPAARAACARLADAGVPLGSQTVLLAGVNDQVAVMKTLMHRLLMARVRPYYLYQCDPIVGSSHFRTPVTKGLEIIEGLRGHTSGYAVPTFVIDAPGGGGKIPLLPHYATLEPDGGVRLRNYEGNSYRYPGEARSLQ